MRVYLDSCAVIYLIEEVEPWFNRISEAIAAVTGLRFQTSDLVRLECLVQPFRSRDTELAEAFRTALARYERAELSAEVFDLAAELRAEHRLRTPDALHIAAAITSGCDEFWTNDHRLDRLDLPLTVRAFSDES